MRRVPLLAAVTLAAALSSCAGHQAPAPPRPNRSGSLETREGLASYYGKEFHGRITVSGVRFDMNALVAAHPSYPFGTLLRVTNLANGRSATVRVVDRGPGPEQRADGLIIDVSRRAAELLGFIERGRTGVRLDVLAWGG